MNFPVRPQFRDRADAGEALALSLSLFSSEANVVVLGLARGGVPIARQVADALGASFGVLTSRVAGPRLRGCTVILVDDGLVTGASLRAAARAVRSQQPKRLVAAVPVASRVGAMNVRPDVDDLVTVIMPEKFERVSAYYADYHPVSEEEVSRLLGRPMSVVAADARLAVRSGPESLPQPYRQ